MRFEARLLTLAVSGCGQKGPLFLPDKTSEGVTRPGHTRSDSQPVTSSAPSPADVPAPPPQEPDSKKKDPQPK
jgi:predicted small lipoprotein YifL